jgi:hypothetical protein
MKILIKIFLLSVFLCSCGDSPFLNDESAPSANQSIVRSLNSSLVFPISKYQIEMFWRQGPLVSKESKILLIVTDQDSTPINLDGNLQVKLWMPTMGHGSFPVKINNTGNGTYELSDVFFTMDGIWDIHFQRIKDSNMLEEIKWQLKL